jgi:hypothetical protein
MNLPEYAINLDTPRRSWKEREPRIETKSDGKRALLLLWFHIVGNDQFVVLKVNCQVDIPALYLH